MAQCVSDFRVTGQAAEPQAALSKRIQVAKSDFSETFSSSFCGTIVSAVAVGHGSGTSGLRYLYFAGDC